MDNVTEFSSKAFNEYCMALGINVEHSVPYVHTQNGLAESLIKRIKLVARSLLHNCNLPISCWGHAVLHTADLIQLRPTAYHTTSPLQLVRGNQPNISHLRKFGCAVYVPILSPQRTSMGPHRKLGIYVGYKSPSIIKYLEPLTGDLFTARHADSIFDEDNIPALGGDNIYQTKCQDIEWNAIGIQSLDPRTKESKLKVQRIIHLQNIANNLPDAFTNLIGVSKSHNPTIHVPERVEIPMKVTQLTNQNKRGRSTVTRVKRVPRKKRNINSKGVNANQPQVDRHQDVQLIHNCPAPSIV